MAKVRVDNVLRAELLGGATKAAPAAATIVSVRLIPAAELPFKSEDDKWEVTVLFNDEELNWFPNKTTLKSFIAAWGDESDDWSGKTMGLYSLTQNVGGEIKNVIYADAK